MTIFEAAPGDSRDRVDYHWQPHVQVSRSVTLPPDPHVMDAIGGNHRLETAVADLVDNSIDAGASRVLLRFVVVDARIQAFYVVDDGAGMTAAQIDTAMTAGAARKYGADELGHFGLGLKAASFSQADSLTVIARAASTRSVGRRWLTSKASSAFECDVVSDEFCDRELDRSWAFIEAGATGTIVRWDAIRVFPSGRDDAVTSRFVQDATMRLRRHLGLVFHRFLERGKIRIGIDVEDVTMRGSGPVVEVGPLDPFGYLRPGANGYPKDLQTTLAGVSLSVVCHIWPGRSQQPQFRLTNASSEQYQGLYFYRRDRLLQAGGWNNVEVARRDLQLARISVDLHDDLVTYRLFRMNPEKSRVESGVDFGEAIDRAEAEDGTTFRDYLDDAREAFKRSSQRTRSRAQIVPLGRGLPPRLRQVVGRELVSLPGYEPVDLRWESLPDEVFFDIDRDTHTIWLNSRYRSAVAGDGRGFFNDAPLVKTMLFLLVENLFHGSWWGPKDKDNLELWQSLLTTAVREQLG